MARAANPRGARPGAGPAGGAGPVQPALAPAPAAVADDPAKAGAVSSALKDQLALVALVVVFAGLRYVDAYYGAFGISYSSLDLPLQYFLYLGVKAVFLSPLIGVAYLIAILWLGVGETWASEHWAARRWAVGLLSYAIVALVAAITYWAGHAKGQEQARRDMTAETTSLPFVVGIRLSEGAEEPSESKAGKASDKKDKSSDVKGKPSEGDKPLYAGARILLSNKDELVLFYLAKYRGYPVLTVVPKDKIDALQVGR